MCFYWSAFKEEIIILLVNVEDNIKKYQYKTSNIKLSKNNYITLINLLIILCF